MYVKVKRRLHVFSLRSNALRDRFALDLKCARAFRVQRAQELREWQCKIGAVCNRRCGRHVFMFRRRF